MIDKDALAHVRRLAGVVGYLVLDRSGAATSGAGAMFADAPMQVSISRVVRDLWQQADATIAAPTSIFVRFSKNGMYVRKFASGTLIVICDASISLAKLAFAVSMSLGIDSSTAPAPVIERTRTPQVVAPTRPTPLPPPPEPKRKTKLGIWD